MASLSVTSAFEDGTTFLKTVHKDAYPAIYPARPELSQAGRTVLITGGSAGIGFAMARAFAQAKAKHIIIIGRRQALIDEAAEKLRGEFPAVQFSSRRSDVGDLTSAEALWRSLEDDGVVVDVLALNAAAISAGGPILDLGREQVWNDFTVNVRSHLDFTERFYQQKGGEGRPKFLINTSTEAIHNFTRAGPYPAYSASKNAGTMLLQMIAKDTPADKMQVINFHPGIVYTEPFARAGIPRDAYPFDTENLGGNFAVWAASEEARFLHGRFVWAGWDVDELRSGEVRDKIEKNGEFLKVGVVGLQE